MSLSDGTRLGPYSIVSPLGAGGMGEVYRATDSRLKRQVAIKILPSGSQFGLSHPEFSPDGHWMAYVSNESGGPEICVQPYPGPGPAGNDAERRLELERRAAASRADEVARPTV